MTRLFIFSTCSILILLSGCATPKPPQWQPLEPSQLGHPLSLDECLDLARQSDLKDAEWRARLASARSNLTAARTLPNPTFQASWEDLGVKDAAGASQATSIYGFSYPIFFWWTRGKEISVAQHQLQAEEQRVRDDRRQLALDIGTAFFDLLAAERKTRATEDLLAEARDALRLAEESFQLGSVSGYDVTLARTEERQARAELFDARRDVRARQLAMAFALGADRPLAVEVEQTTLTLPSTPAETTTDSLEVAETVPGNLIDRALAADPAAAQARASREAAEARYRLEVRRILPLADAQASAARKNTPDGMGYDLGFDIPIPLFDWNQGGLARAKADLLAARTQEEQARRKTIARLAEAWQAYASARRRQREYSANIARARAKLAGDAQDLFASGQIGYSDLLQARREWRQAELAAVDSWRQSMTAGWKVLCLVGARDATGTGTDENEQG